MSNNIKIELNSREIGRLLKSDTMKGACESLAGSICNRCGDGYTVGTWRGNTRVVARVEASTEKAKRDNQENNTLLKARGG